MNKPPTKDARCPFIIVVAFALSGCSGAGGGAASVANPPVAATATPASRKIDHVVIVIQENRSFDNFFATFPGADGATHGQLHTGRSVPLISGSLVTRDLPHDHLAFTKEYDGGKMDGFDTIRFVSGGGTAGRYPYRYVKPSDIAPYWAMARQYVLADHMFQTQGSGSFTGHQDLIAGSTAIDNRASLVDFPSSAPWGCDAPSGTVTSLLTEHAGYVHRGGPFPCLDYSTLRDLLDKADLSWKYYAPPFDRPYGGIWDAFDAIRAVRFSSEWSHNISTPETNIFHDITHNALPAVAWVVPDGRNSDHPGGSATGGPSWVAAVVNAIGQSPDWTSTAVVVVWDDWGGLYDHVTPPQIDYQGLGFRVPCLIISPYARKGYVSHTHYEFASILKFIEDNWGLGRINQNDRRANSIGDTFDLTQAPRAFKAIDAPLDQSYFERQRPSYEPVDDE